MYQLSKSFSILYNRIYLEGGESSEVECNTGVSVCKNQMKMTTDADSENWQTQHNILDQSNADGSAKINKQQCWHSTHICCGDARRAQVVRMLCSEYVYTLYCGYLLWSQWRDLLILLLSPNVIHNPHQIQQG